MNGVLADVGFLKKSIPASKNKFQFIYEAIVNALEANNTNDIQIQILFRFISLRNGSNNQLEQLDIIDNGEGFTDKNYKRFTVLGDASKRKNNRGCGRFQFYHNFENVEITSVYTQNKRKMKRAFSYDSNSLAESMSSNPKDAQADEKCKTVISLKRYCGKHEEIHSLSISDFVNQLQNDLLLHFYLEKKAGKRISIKIIFEYPENKREEKSITNESIREPDQKGEIYIHYEKLSYPEGKPKFERLEKKETINWAHFKIEDSKGNEVKYCSKNIPVCDARISSEINEACQYSKNRYLTVFYGDVLDREENIKDSVDGFNFPKKEDFKEQDLFHDENKEYLFFDTIENEVKESIPNIYSEVKRQLDNQKESARKIAEEYGINPDYANKIKVNVRDENEKIVKRLYCAQAEKLADNAVKIREIDKSLNSIDPTNNDYEDELVRLAEKRLKLTTEQDREELSKYVIRRSFVTELLRKILDDKLSCQQKKDGKKKPQQKEKIIHDLFFKRKTDTSNLNDLWLLKEDFIYYDGYSNTPLSQIKLEDGECLLNDKQSISDEDDRELLERTPDVYLLKDEETCVIIEFKDKNVDLAECTQQPYKYCRLIANHAKLKIKKFFCYLIGEKLTEKDLDSHYAKTIRGDMIYTSDVEDKNKSPIAKYQLEIIRLSSLEKRAEVRNRIFAKKLGFIEEKATKNS